MLGSGCKKIHTALEKKENAETLILQNNSKRGERYENKKKKSISGKLGVCNTQKPRVTGKRPHPASPCKREGTRPLEA